MLDLKPYAERCAQLNLNLYAVRAYHAGEVSAIDVTKNRRRELYSLSKSFLSMAIGMLISEGRLSLDDRLTDFIPEFAAWNPAAARNGMRIRHLLTMTAGQPEAYLLGMQRRAITGDAYLRHYLTRDFPYLPGTHFCYDTGCSYVLSAIVTRVTGEKLVDYLKPRLFDRLGIRDPVWTETADGVNTGGYGLRLDADEVLTFGRLLLNGGRRNGMQIVDPDYLKAATSKQADSSNCPFGGDCVHGYGYQFWLNRDGGYRAAGVLGQYMVVFPQYGAVIVTAANEQNDQKLLDVMYDVLIPQIGECGGF